jgi:hypothetical protein
MKLSALLAPLLDAKADHDTIRKVVLAFEAEQTDALEQRRKADAERQARKRSRDVTLRHSDRSLTGAGDAPVEDKSLTTNIEPQVKKQDAPSRDVDAFRAGLSPDVPFDLISEFIKVRRKKRGALTGFAAKLFRDDAAAVGMTVAEAATECVRSSWITVKPEYFQNRQRAGPAPPKPNPALAAANALMEKLDAVSPSETQGNQAYPRLVAFTGGG